MRYPEEIARKHLRGQEVIWRVICDLSQKQGEFTIREIDGRQNAHLNDVRNYVKRLAAGGYLERCGMRGRAVLYKKVRHSRTAPRVRKDGSPVVQGSAQDNMWRAMRMMREFNYIDVAINATTDSVRISHVHARSYCQALRSAGYLSVVTPGGPNRPAVFRLKRNTGPAAPMIQRTKRVFDPNLNEVVWRSDNPEHK